MDKRRNDIDYCKALAITLVLVGHITQYTSQIEYVENPIWKFIYSFHMPLFAFLSGMFFKSTWKDSFMKMIIKRGKTLLLPAFSWGVIGLILLSINNIENAKKLFSFHYFFNVFWFLSVLFICYVITYLIIHYLKNTWLRMLVLGVIMFFSFDARVTYLLPSFMAGVLYDKYEFVFYKYRLQMIGGSLCLYVIGFFYLSSFTLGLNYNCLYNSALSAIGGVK